MFLLPLLTAPSLQAPPPPPPFPLLHPRLGLDAAQRTQIEALLARHHEALQAKREAFEQARQALRAALGDPARSQADLEALLSAEASAHRDHALAAHALLREAAQVLRPDQREALATLRPHLGPGPGQGQGPGRGPGMGPGPRGPRPEGGARGFRP